MKDLPKELRKAKVEEPHENSNQIPKHFAEKLNTIFVDISKFSEATQSMETIKHYIIKSGDQQYPLIYTHFFFDQHNMLEKIIRKQWSNYLKNTPHIKYAVYFQAREVMCSLSNQISFFFVSEMLQERDCQLGCICLDFEKACNQVSHNLLTWKWEHLGRVQRKFLKYMKAFRLDLARTHND